MYSAEDTGTEAMVMYVQDYISTHNNYITSCFVI